MMKLFSKIRRYCEMPTEIDPNLRAQWDAENKKRDDQRNRQWLAQGCLHGLLSDPASHPEQRQGNETCAEATARIAVEYADALIEALEKPVWRRAHLCRCGVPLRTPGEIEDRRCVACWNADHA